MFGQDRESDTGDPLDRGSSVVTYRLHLQYWEERIVAGLSGDERLQAAVEREGDFGEWFICRRIHGTVEGSILSEGQLGKVLVRTGCLGLGKRSLASAAGISPVKAQQLLNQYYAVFVDNQRWLKENGPKNAQRIVAELIDGYVQDSLRRCLARIPWDWKHAGELVFELPSYIYDVQAVKFFHHFFEREVEIEGSAVRLPIRIE